MPRNVWLLVLIASTSPACGGESAEEVEVSIGSSAQPLSGQLPCDSLKAAVSIPNATIDTVKVESGAFTPQAPGATTIFNLPAFCRVTATARPSPQSNVKVEVWLPTSTWNGRLVGVGNSGFGGNIPYEFILDITKDNLASRVRQGYAVVTSDLGTTPATSFDGDPLIGMEEKQKDFGFRATHSMTLVAKSIVQAFYGRPQSYSYFSGCSQGGEQGLSSAQMFPEDYDGVVAGSPGNNRTHLATALLSIYRANNPTPTATGILNSKLSFIRSRVLQACAGRDGGLATDAFLTDPRDCAFDPGILQCAGADTATCLTVAQVAALRSIYAGPRNPTTGELIYPGVPRGAEVALLQSPVPVIGPVAPGVDRNGQTRNEPAFASLPRWVFGAGFTPASFNFDTDVDKVNDSLAFVVSATRTDLTPFEARGGKLILYHGFEDQVIAPQDTINYFNRIVESQASSGHAGTADALAHTRGFVRLFMAPGMQHCVFGNGPSQFDALDSVVRWVEQGVAPTRIVATTFGSTQTRPLCPFPEQARFNGGFLVDPNQAANFTCVSDPSAAQTNQVQAQRYVTPCVRQPASKHFTDARLTFQTFPFFEGSTAGVFTAAGSGEIPVAFIAPAGSNALDLLVRTLNTVVGLRESGPSGFRVCEPAAFPLILSPQ